MTGIDSRHYLVTATQNNLLVPKPMISCGDSFTETDLKVNLKNTEFNNLKGCQPEKL